MYCLLGPVTATRLFAPFDVVLLLLDLWGPQVLLARLQEDSYRMLAGRETDRETGAGELKGPCLAYLEDPPLLQYQQARIDQQAALSSLSSVSNPSMAATFPVGTPRKHLLPGSSPHSLQKRRPYPGTFLGPFPAPHPPPREWEGRVRDCLAELKHRPFICPDEMLRSTGAVPSLAPEAYTRDDVRRRAPNGEYQHMDGFRLSQVCLLLALDLIEEAVLKEGGGEAEAGLLRALRTPRVSGVEAKAGVRLTLGGQARGRMDGAELSALVGLLEEVRKRFLSSGEDNFVVLYSSGFCRQETAIVLILLSYSFLLLG